MKKIILNLAIVLSTVSASAGTISSGENKIEPSGIDKVIRLVDKNDYRTGHKKVSIVVEDKGMSTDVSPRYTVYLGYSSLAEMGNIWADFKINNNVFEFLSATRKAPGIYEVKVIEYRDEFGMTEVTHTIDATKMFSDEREMLKKCGDDFCDGELKTSIQITETTKLK